MSIDGGALDLDPAYIAGLFDMVGRIRFDISDTREDTYTVRPMLRLRPYQTRLRAAVIGEFLEERNYHYDFIERDYGDQFFRLQQHSDLQDLQTFLEGQSAHLVRELTFVNGIFADEFDFSILDPQEIYRFTLLRDKLRYGWRPKGRYHLSPDDIVERHNINTDQGHIPPIPVSELRSDYTVEWIAGVYDGQCRYRPSIGKSPESKISYGMWPVARIHRAGVCSNLVTSFFQFCDDYNLAYGDSSKKNTLHVIFTGPSNIRRILDVLFPQLLVLAEASEVLANGILPRFDANHHHEKQGFYEILRDFDDVAKASGGPFRHREYDPAYFADKWREDLKLTQEETRTSVSAFTQRMESEDLRDVTLSTDEFEGTIGRYHTLLDRVQRNSKLVTKLKSLYNDRCQICGARLASGDGTGYSEVHHIRPLGTPHEGPDRLENMLVLCPNHHADFDNGVIRVDLDDLSIEHPYDSEADGKQLSVEPEHNLLKSGFRYHNQNICRLQ